MQLELTRGKQTLVCSCHYDLVAQYKWCYTTKGYARRSRYDKGQRVSMSMHGLIVGASKGQVVDHVNRNRLDNRCSNLRIVTAYENAWNTNNRRDNRSGYRNVQWHKQTRAWRVVIVHKKKNYFFGYYQDAEEAAQVAAKARKELRGKYAV